jgi:aspartate-semialdehyde dehydrogenase
VKQKIPVGILGATGSVGQKFVELLENHPWFDISTLTASGKSAGKLYGDLITTGKTGSYFEKIYSTKIEETKPGIPCRLVFSALDAKVAGTIEQDFARSGYIVVSNARNHRFEKDVPLLIPEINPDHLQLTKMQKWAGGMIVTNPNCSTTGLALALKPLYDNFGLESVMAVTMQAISGAGYPGLSALDINENVIPFISGEEDKMESEPLKILGKFNGSSIDPAAFKLSISCNRVPVIDGHLESVAVKLHKSADISDIINTWTSYSALPQKLKLPLAPQKPIYYFTDPALPQPKYQRNLEHGMAVSIGRLRHCKILDFKFTLLVHNTIRGAAGGAILNAELMTAQKIFK